MNFKKIFVLCLCFLLFPFSVSFSDDAILYISDHDTDDEFSERYTNTLQSFISSQRANKKIKIEKFLGFNINTTESIELINMFCKKNIPKAIVLMVGESNYYNVYGFAKFMDKKDRESETDIVQNKKNVKEINSEMSDIYNSYKESSVNPSVKAAYGAVFPVENGKIFHPSVVPEFYALDEKFTFESNVNLMSAVSMYKHSWDLIRNGEYDKAKEFLNNILKKKFVYSMFYYALSSAYLAENGKDCEKKALKLLEEGILLDPLDKKNICYKGIMSMFMMYKGEITSEILFFSRALNKCFLNISDEISAINAINTPDYDSKIEIIDDWILSDFDEIQKICYSLKIPFIFASYPDNADINSLIYGHVKDSAKSAYVENKIDKSENKDGTEVIAVPEKTDSYIYDIAKNMYKFLKEKGIVY
ncbi:MAG: hypothetical protein II816_05300 [Elusimicrobia bacterium]|nr:hypothetical protein [Elusimicrobiota bacterium]